MVGFYNYPFTGANEQTKQTVWRKGRVIAGYDAAIWRHDRCGQVMRYSDHGDRSADYGWEIDHVMPTALGGPNIFDNLQPLNWRNNAAKGDQYPWSC